MEESQSGVEFVNLCDKQGGSSSSAASSAVPSGSSAASSGSGVVPTSSASSSTSPLSSAHPSLAERVRQEAGASPAQGAVPFGTPKQPHPRQLILDKAYPGRGTVKPGIGLGSGGGGNGANGSSSPVAAVGERSLQPQASGPNMLLVEDVRVSQRIAIQALTRASYKVIAADNGEAAVEKYKQHANSLKYIIMDINVSQGRDTERW